jgi:hypothetical protein
MIASNLLTNLVTVLFLCVLLLFMVYQIAKIGTFGFFVGRQHFRNTIQRRKDGINAERYRRADQCEEKGGDA